ncbi:hypothetical protein GCM10009718_29530 [Isoptericola halotolerans]|uniref:Membrane protein YesL n=1 Tax=Isoptericola halotolerans TaxID=300560 RepID=A0ABX2A558_9MICO|nr:hypothetical protein [Isoptericola halotolerans]NOV97706.1 hypothetical protein [Isoptericola halotolerans]
MRTPAEHGSGPLSQIAGAVFRYTVLGLCLVVTCAPTLVVIVLLGQGSSTVPFQVLALLPVAPALSAGLWAVRGWQQDADASAFLLFVRGCRRNVGDVLRWWVPTLAVGGVLGANVALADVVPGAELVRGLSIVVAVLLPLWSGQMLIVTTFFAFRTRDAARIAAAELFSSWRVTLAHVSLLVVAVGVVRLGTEALLLFCAWAFVALLEVSSRPTVRDVRVRFTVRA